MGLVGPIFIGLVVLVIIIGLWAYNSSQTDQASRYAAYHLAITGNQGEAEQAGYNYLSKTVMGATINSVSVYWNGDVACATAETEMETYLPGLPKLFNSSSPNWLGKVTIIKEAVTTGDFQARPSNQGYF